MLAVRERGGTAPGQQHDLQRAREPTRALARARPTKWRLASPSIVIPASSSPAAAVAVVAPSIQAVRVCELLRELARRCAQRLQPPFGLAPGGELITG